MEKFNLQEIAGGALQEKANQALQQVLNNMQNPNTPWKNKRAVTIKMTFTQNEDRDDSTCEISVDTKLAPVKPVETKFSLGKNLKTGEVEAVEYGPGIKGQMTLSDIVPKEDVVIDGKTVDTGTGEIKDNNVISIAR